MSVGSPQGWQPICEEDLADRWRIYYPGYQLLGFQDMAQSGTTRLETSVPESLTSCVDHAELIDEVSGRRINARCTWKDQVMEVSPQEELAPDGVYWLVLENDQGQGGIGVLNAVGD
jgi:carboxyl-terminal processing protease